MEKAVTRRKWTAGLLITGTVALVVAFWSLIMSMLSLLAVAGVLTLLSLPLCKVLEKRLPGGAAAAIALLTLLGAVLGMLWGLTVSYTHLRGPRDKRQSRMPSSA